MRREDLEHIELSAGWCNNLFTMNRGSFFYTKLTTNRIRLSQTAQEPVENGVRYYYTFREFTIVLEVVDLDGKTMVKVTDYPKDRINVFLLSFTSADDEKIYGCGENYVKFNLNGEKVRIWVAEHQNVRRIGRKMIRDQIFDAQPERSFAFNDYESYYAQPTFVSSEKYFVHADTSTYAEFNFKKSGRINLYFQEPPVLTFAWADSFEELSKKQAELLGTPKNLPDWIFDGAILAVQEGTQRVEEKIRDAKEADVKLCGIWSQDWCGCRRTGFGYQVMWNWRWDEDLYPGLTEKIPQWREEGIHFLGYINPFMALEGEIYKEASEKGYCVKDRKGEDYLVKITTFPAAMIDFTNPEAYAWYKEIIKKNLIGIGLDGWMADFGEYLPVDSVLFSGEDPYKVHNQWPVFWAKCNREAIEECQKEGEVFFFTRAGYTGTIRESAMMWTGDQHVDWYLDDGLAAVIPATLSLGLSGYPYAHSDAGGYTTVMKMTRSRELLMRWAEMNIFSPLFRTHEGNQPSRNVQIYDTPGLLSHLAFCSRIHAGLKDYLLDCVHLA